MLPTLMRAIARRAPAIGIAVVIIVAATAYLTQPPHEAQSDPAAEFQLIGPHGDTAVMRLPALANIPPLDLDAACVTLKAHNATARALRGSWSADGYSKRVVYDRAEAACPDPAARDYDFYDALGDVLNAGALTTHADADQLIGAMREALRTAKTAGQVATTFNGLETRATALADPLHAPEFFLIGAEASAARLPYCTEPRAAKCRADANSDRGRDLTGAGRWLGETRYLRDGIAAYRDALRDVPPKSGDWVDLHTLIGSALAILSEQGGPDSERASLLRQALAEYDEAAGAVRASDEYTWALINQNVCSIRQPLAAIDKDRASTMRAIGECEKALAYYEKHEEQEEQAAAHYNMARAYERLAEWDRDAGQAMHAVEHVRRTVALYSAERLTLSRAMGEVHLAEALLDTADLTGPANEERRTALRAEARASLDAAEPILRSAQAATYLGRLDDARARVGR